MGYRKRQLDVLQSASPPISDCISLALSPNSICPNPVAHLERGSETGQTLSLECAFEWLHSNYRSICIAVVQMISEDQEEPLPLNWRVLVEDWDHAYWIIWIYLVSIIQLQDRDAFKLQHASLSTWLAEMKE